MVFERLRVSSTTKATSQPKFQGDAIISWEIQEDISRSKKVTPQPRCSFSPLSICKIILIPLGVFLHLYPKIPDDESIRAISLQFWWFLTQRECLLVALQV